MPRVSTVGPACWASAVRASASRAASDGGQLAQGKAGEGGGTRVREDGRDRTGCEPHQRITQAGKHPGHNLDRRRRRAECRMTRAASRMRHMARKAVCLKRQHNAPLQRILSVAGMRDMPDKSIL